MSCTAPKLKNNIDGSRNPSRRCSLNDVMYYNQKDGSSNLPSTDKSSKRQDAPVNRVTLCSESSTAQQQHLFGLSNPARRHLNFDDEAICEQDNKNGLSNQALDGKSTGKQIAPGNHEFTENVPCSGKGIPQKLDGSNNPLKENCSGKM